MKHKKYGISVAQIYKYGFKLAIEVYDKFNRKCYLCDNVDVLAIHHLDGSGKSKYPNNNLENLQLLCRSCHCKIHMIEYWGKKAKERGGYVCKGKTPKEYSHNYYMRNREREIKRSTAYQKKHIEDLRKYRREYYREYNKTHREKKNACSMKSYYKRKLLKEQE
jgi:hypothetical protein